VADRGEFQEQVRKLGELVTQFEEMPDSPQKTAAKELVQFLMEVHSQGLERMMELIFESRDSGSALIDRFGKDDLAGGLLLLYSLHPDALEARVQAAVERMRAKLGKLSCAVELLSIEGGAVRVQLTAGGHSCGSSTREVRAIVENGIYELAPDVGSLEILGPEEPTSTGFVALETLVAGAARNGNTVLAGGAH
jgi:Fe-S cluster biogenesis protein NfuA